MTGITIGVGIFLVLLHLALRRQDIGESNLVSPFFAVWTPNLLSFVLAVYLWTKMHRETPFYIASLWRPLALLGRAGARAPQTWGGRA